MSMTLREEYFSSLPVILGFHPSNTILVMPMVRDSAVHDSAVHDSTEHDETAGFAFSRDVMALKPEIVADTSISQSDAYRGVIANEVLAHAVSKGASSLEDILIEILIIGDYDIEYVINLTDILVRDENSLFPPEMTNVYRVTSIIAGNTFRCTHAATHFSGTRFSGTDSCNTNTTQSGVIHPLTETEAMRSLIASGGDLPALGLDEIVARYSPGGEALGIAAIDCVDAQDIAADVAALRDRFTKKILADGAEDTPDGGTTGSEDTATVTQMMGQVAGITRLCVNQLVKDWQTENGGTETPSRETLSTIAFMLSMDQDTILERLTSLVMGFTVPDWHIVIERSTTQPSGALSFEPIAEGDDPDTADVSSLVSRAVHALITMDWSLAVALSPREIRTITSNALNIVALDHWFNHERYANTPDNIPVDKLLDMAYDVNEENRITYLLRRHIGQATPAVMIARLIAIGTRITCIELNRRMPIGYGGDAETMDEVIETLGFGDFNY